MFSHSSCLNPSTLWYVPFCSIDLCCFPCCSRNLAKHTPQAACFTRPNQPANGNMVTFRYFDLLWDFSVGVFNVSSPEPQAYSPASISTETLDGIWGLISQYLWSSSRNSMKRDLSLCDHGNELGQVIDWLLRNPERRQNRKNCTCW